ncbi:hypothetical protein [Orenia marismortui]|uniref:hypothetical protein n=1 Tax=Orenia marismortui TaxID=46469 RepID=UPI00036F8C11|nr:hypothetical protein [Orenia marismortui]
MKYKNNRYQVELENGQGVTISIQEMKAWANLTYLVPASRARVKRVKQDVFDLYDGTSYLGSVQVVSDPADTKVPYTFKEAEKVSVEQQLKDILDALAKAQASIESGMTDHEAQAYYLEPLKDVVA